MPCQSRYLDLLTVFSLENATELKNLARTSFAHSTQVNMKIRKKGFRKTYFVRKKSYIALLIIFLDIH